MRAIIGVCAASILSVVMVLSPLGSSSFQVWANETINNDGYWVGYRCAEELGTGKRFCKNTSEDIACWLTNNQNNCMDDYL